MNVVFDFGGTVALVTGANGILGSAIAHAFYEAGASIAAADVVEPDNEDDFFETEEVQLYKGDFTDEDGVAHVVDEVVSDFGRPDYLADTAGVWHDRASIGETDAGTSDFLFDVNLKIMLLVSKHTIPHPRETEGSVVNVSVRSSSESGEGDGIYRASKTGVRLLTEAIAEESRNDVCVNTVTPSVIDTPMNHEMMVDTDFGSWVKPAGIARTVLALCSGATPMTGGAVIPVYGET